MKLKFSMAAAAFAVMFTAAAQAGVGYVPSKQSKAVVVPELDVPNVCDCFDQPSLGLDLFGGAVIADGDGLDDSALGGLGLTYFTGPYLGFSGSVYWWDDGEAIVHSVTGSVILRYPIRSICIAPYLIGGVGGHFDSVNQITGHLGGGLEVRCPWADCLGIFADGVYTWADESDNYTVVRAGVRINF